MVPSSCGAYGRIGRVEGALAQAAEEVFTRLSPDDQQRAEVLFVRLVSPGEAGGATRRVAHVDEFERPTRALAAKLSQEEQWRLLTSHEDTVEIAHEQLATQWLRYQRWIANIPGDPAHGTPPDPRGDDLRLLRPLMADGARWQAAPSDRKAQTLASGVDLELYGQLAIRRQAWLSELERRFVRESEAAERARAAHVQAQVAERERLLREGAETEKARAQEQAKAVGKARRLRNLALIATAVLLLALGAASYLWRDAGRQRDQAQKAEREALARQLATQATLALTSPPTDVVTGLSSPPNRCAGSRPSKVTTSG